jgi:hypothetical protein
VQFHHHLHHYADELNRKKRFVKEAIITPSVPRSLRMNETPFSISLHFVNMTGKWSTWYCVPKLSSLLNCSSDVYVNFFIKY